MASPAAARSSLSPSERELRSRITQFLHNRWLLDATLAPRASRCGKPNCRCARGEPHPALSIIQSRQGQGRQLFVPKDWEPRIRQAVADYQKLQQLLEEVSEQEWKRLQSHREK